MRLRQGIAGLIVVLAASALAGCGGIQVQAQSKVPPPLVDRLPVTAGIVYTPEFRSFEHKEKRAETEYGFQLGAAHVVKLDRLVNALFSKVEHFDSLELARKSATPLALILEPRFEDYSFITPRETAGQNYAVTIQYRLNLYSPDGQLVDSFQYTGYGAHKAGGMSSETPLIAATERAMRDAAAKFAVEFPEQQSVQALLRGEVIVQKRDQQEEVRAALGVFGTEPAPAATTPATSPPATAPGTEPPVAPPPASDSPPAAPAVPPGAPVESPPPAESTPLPPAPVTPTTVTPGGVRAEPPPETMPVDPAPQPDPVE